MFLRENTQPKEAELKYDWSSLKYLVKVGDLGDLELRQYNKIFAKYEIRNAWSPPEVLVNPDLAYSHGNTSIDIYSFGMIMWEVYSSNETLNLNAKIPFADDFEVAKEYVANKKLRPKIGEEVPKHIAKIIKK